MYEPDGTIYCARQDRIIGIERCYGCEFALVVSGQVACAYEDLGPFRRIAAAFRAIVRRPAESTPS